MENNQNLENKKPMYSVIIPTYNESKRYKEMVAHLHSIEDYFSSLGQSYEILIVLDGPTDGTDELVREQAEKFKAIRIIERKKNRGKGYTVREGLMKAQGQIRLFTDMDGATPIKMLDRMIPLFQNGADIVIGSRDIAGTEIKKHQPMWKELLGNIGNILIQTIAGLWGIRDTQCGFKAFTEKAVNDIIPRTTVERWGVDFEILVIGKKRGFAIKEVPVEWLDAGNSLVGISGYIVTLRELAKVRWNLIKGVYKLKEDVGK